jgi:hypothetical protein
MELSSMSAATIVTVENYLHRTEKPYCEYLDGVLRPKGVADHGSRTRSIFVTSPA